MEKNENLFNHVSRLCEILNENNIKETFFNGKEQTLINWKTYKEKPSATFLGSICQNHSAFSYLKKNGHIDIGVCWRCGAEPINNKYIFTDFFNKNASFFICKSCYYSGNKIKKKSNLIVFVFKLLFYSIILYLLYSLFALIF